MGSPDLLFASCLPLIAAQKKFQAFLGWLFEDINKTCTYGTEERKAFFPVFSLETEILHIFSKQVCCRVSCLEVVASLVLSLQSGWHHVAMSPACAPCSQSIGSGATPSAVHGSQQPSYSALATAFIVYRPNLNQYLGATAT